jgi:putative membrane protein
MKKTIIALIAVMVLGLSSSAFAAAAVSEKTAAFVKGAAVGGMFEIESSKLALKKSSSPDVKSFASQMITDHGKAGKGLKLAVKRAKIDPTIAPRSLDDAHEAKLSDLKKSKDFDKDYISAQVDAHDEAVTLFEDYSRDGDNDTLKTFASKTLPTLKNHQDHIKMLAGKE